MISNQMLQKIDERLQIILKKGVLFGGLSFVLIGVSNSFPQLMEHPFTNAKTISMINTSSLLC